MTVLTITGGKINWMNPPKPTTKVLWSQRDMYGRKVTGSFRTICALEHTNYLAKKKFGRGIVVIQPPFNTGVAASAGTHDYDACLDVYIPGVPWLTQEKFFRANGWGAYWRRPPLFGNHIHMFVLPTQEGKDRADDYKVFGFKVGKFVDGGWSLLGRMAFSAQINDYYAHRNALANHAKDPDWFPSDIKATIFNLPAYVKAKQAQTPVKTTTIVAGHLNIPAPGVGIGKDLGNDAARIKAAVTLMNKVSCHLLTWNELGPIQSKGVASVFATALFKAFGTNWTPVIPTLTFNENYISFRNDRLKVIDRPGDVVLVAPRGSGNKHLTVAVFQHHEGLEFVAGVTQLPPTVGTTRELDRQDMATAAQKALAKIAGTRPYVLFGDMNTPKDLTGPVAAKMKRTRKWADKSDGPKATYTNYFTADKPSTNAAAWEIDQQYVSSHWYVLTYKVLRLLTLLGKYVQPRPSDHDGVVSSFRANH